MFKKLFSIAALSAIATVAYAGSAQAVGLTYGSGILRDSNVTNEGAFSENVNDLGYETFDFNDSRSLPGNDKVKYSYSGTNTNTRKKTQVVNNDKKANGKWKNGEMKWAPTGVINPDTGKAFTNESQYLQVFKGKSVVIETVEEGDTFNYFGLNMGALSKGNIFEFFNGDEALVFNYIDKQGNAKSTTTLTENILSSLAPTAADQHGGQKNGFFEFFSEGMDDNFDKIVISQTTGGGFETDNHTFRIAKGKYAQASVPEPSIALGMLAFSGGMFLRKRKQKKSVE
ncbi:MAG: PEP-CTERM sorting domain-containing protein [Cyanobacteria bacterium P01_A01_bin.68]